MPAMPSSSASAFLITGGAGFVGSNLCAALARRHPGAVLTVVDDFRSGSFASLVEAFARAEAAPFAGEIIARSVEDVAWRELLASRPFRAVFHLGAITDTTVADEREMIRVNAEASERLMVACAERGVPLVYASSAATYGSPPEARDRRPFPLASAGRPNNVYGFSKWLMESAHRRVAAAAGSAPPHIVGLRYFNVFGPGESRKGKMASMAFQLCRQMLEGRRPRLFADGSQARDQVYVDDVVECTLAGAGVGGEGPERRPLPGVYNAGSGEATSFNDIASAVRRGLGLGAADLPTEYFEMPAPVRAFYQDYTCADVSETRRALGWSPRCKPLDATARYAAHLKAIGTSAGA